MSRVSMLLIFSVAAGGCFSEPPAPAPAPVTARPNTTPAEALDRMDPRRPVPLLPSMANHQKQSMRDHLVAVQEIASAVALSDFAAVETAASRIGLTEQMGQMCEHMGAGAPGFSKQAIEFHETADRIGAAARARDGAAVLRELSATLQACTSCHAAWKQQVVDEKTWQELTALPPSSGDSPHPHRPM